MPFSVSLMRKLDKVSPELKEILWAILDEIEQHREQSVTRSDFNELKEIVRELGQTTRELVKAQKQTDQRLGELAEAQKQTGQRLGELAEAQKRTDQRLGELAEAQKELIEAQKRTDQRLGELAEAQKQTEQRLGELAEAQKRTDQRLGELAEAQKNTEEEVRRLAQLQEGTRSHLGGLSRSVAYALENEAYRKLPAYLKSECHLDIQDRFIRTTIGEEEINIFANATRDGEKVVIVGESVLRLDDRLKMKQLEDKVKAVQNVVTQPIVPLIIAHYAHPSLLEKARKEGVIVVQSFEWG